MGNLLHSLASKFSLDEIGKKFQEGVTGQDHADVSSQPQGFSDKGDLKSIMSVLLFDIGLFMFLSLIYICCHGKHAILPNWSDEEKQQQEEEKTDYSPPSHEGELDNSTLLLQSLGPATTESKGRFENARATEAMDPYQAFKGNSMSDKTNLQKKII